MFIYVYHDVLRRCSIVQLNNVTRFPAACINIGGKYYDRLTDGCHFFIVIFIVIVSHFDRGDY